MFAMIDLRGEQIKSSDQAQLQAYLQQLVGEPFIRFRFSYGDELSLHFGKPREYASPRMNHLVKGSYLLGTRASNWHLKSSSPTILVFGSCESAGNSQGATPLTKKQLETSDYIRPGSIVVSATLQPMTSSITTLVGYGLSLLLSDGSSLLITPEPIVSGQPESDLADWELFTPYERFLQVGPGMEWSYRSTRQKSLPRTV